MCLTIFFQANRGRKKKPFSSISPQPSLTQEVFRRAWFREVCFCTLRVRWKQKSLSWSEWNPQCVFRKRPKVIQVWLRSDHILVDTELWVVSRTFFASDYLPLRLILFAPSLPGKSSSAPNPSDNMIFHPLIIFLSYCSTLKLKLIFTTSVYLDN